MIIQSKHSLDFGNKQKNRQITEEELKSGLNNFNKNAQSRV